MHENIFAKSLLIYISFINFIPKILISGIICKLKKKEINKYNTQRIYQKNKIYQSLIWNMKINWLLAKKKIALFVSYSEMLFHISKTSLIKIKQKIFFPKEKTLPSFKINEAIQFSPHFLINNNEKSNTILCYNFCKW